MSIIVKKELAYTMLDYSINQSSTDYTELEICPVDEMHIPFLCY